MFYCTDMEMFAAVSKALLKVSKLLYTTPIRWQLLLTLHVLHSVSLLWP